MDRHVLIFFDKSKFETQTGLPSCAISKKEKKKKRIEQKRKRKKRERNLKLTIEEQTDEWRRKGWPIMAVFLQMETITKSTGWLKKKEL